MHFVSFFGCRCAANETSMPGRKHYANLDILRAVSAILIVFHHYQQHFQVRFRYINFYDGRFSVGWLVELFFMISGFLMVASDRPESPVVKTFLRKCLRFYPSVFCSLLAVLGIIGICDPQTLLSLKIQVVLANFLLVYSGWALPIVHGLNNPTWYLCILILCFLLFYGVKLFCRWRKWSPVPAWWLIALTSVVLWDAPVEVPLLTSSAFRGYSCFFLGAVLYDGLQNHPHQFNLRTGLLLLGFAVPVLLFWPSNWRVLVMAGYPGLLISAVCLPQIQSRWITLLGKTSFQLYIWHSPLYKLATLLLPSQFTHSAWTMVAAMLLMQCFAWGMYRWFEMPTARWIRARLQ